MKKQRSLALIAWGLMLGAGFGQIPGDPLAMPGMEFISANPDELMAQADQLLQQGDTNGAVNTLMRSYEIGLQQNGSRFSSVLNTMFTAGRLGEAEQLYQSDQAQRDALTREYYNRLHQYYVDQGSKQALLAWSAELWKKDLPPDLRTQAFGWLLEGSREFGRVEQVLSLVSVCIANFDAATARSLLNSVVSAYDAAGEQKVASKVLDAVEQAAGEKAELKNLVACWRVNLLFSEKKWKAAEERFQQEAPALADGDLAGCWQYAQQSARKAKQLDLLDRLCDFLLKEQKKKSSTWQAAAAAWLQNAKERKAVSDIPARLEALLKLGCANDTLRSHYFQYWALVTREGKSADLSALTKFGDRLAATFKSKDDKELLRPLALNNYFLLEDFEGALKLLKEPLPEMDAKQHEIAINKLKAHLALQKGNKPEALERFRAFMETVKTWTKAEFDPLTDMSITKEMCLGLNAKRIGDILSTMNDLKGSQAAYREAQEYYASAQKTVKENSPESEHIKECQTELAKLLKK